MAKKKATEPDSMVVPTKIGILSIDYGREDLNTMGRKINELIERFNERL